MRITFLKVFFEFIIVLFLFYGLVLGCEACRILAPPPEIEPASLHWKVKF